ncbi:P-loop containing nucleoside triphosphate hydrolase protein [Dichotomocladium elegans]|nr:P-loop containing nucleoside triphosphate hydrolase protein [Dichotomocladium elegans]
MNKETTTLKLLLIGDSGVGKSSLLLRLIDDDFLPPEEAAATIGVDFRMSTMEIDGKTYKLTIWDTAGQERFRTLTSSYYRGAQGVILVYDVTKRESFDNLKMWWNEVETYTPSSEVVKMVVGNKVDKESSRVVSFKEGGAFARKMGTLFIECSAKANIGVREAFEELVTKIIETPSLWKNKTSPNKLSINPQENTESTGCSC